MGNNAIKVERMKKKLSQFSSDKLALLDDFIQTKLSTGSPKESQSIKQLEGIWQGLGFENIDVEKEVQQMRSEIDSSVTENLKHR